MPEKAQKEIQKLLANSDNGKILKEGISTVIIGKPNAGKSSLLNTLVGEERAIVTDIAGTTRDVLEEQINLNGIILNVIDTAGIRETDDVVEKIGVDRAKKYLNEADLAIYVARIAVQKAVLRVKAGIFETSRRRCGRGHIAVHRKFFYQIGSRQELLFKASLCAMEIQKTGNNGIH